MKRFFTSLQNQKRGASASLCFSEAGMTLMEIIIVLTIMAGLVGFAVTSIGSSPVKKMRQESARLLRVVRYVYYQAAAQSYYYRIVFDLSEQTYKVEYSENPFYVVKEGDALEEMRLKNEERNKDLSQEESEEENPAPTADSFAESEDDLLELFKLPEGIRISDIYVLHQKEKIEEGKAYLYFFPNGLTEFAVIHLSDEEGEEAMTVIINPLTGIADIREGYVDHEDILEEMNEQ